VRIVVANHRQYREFVTCALGVFEGTRIVTHFTLMDPHNAYAPRDAQGHSMRKSSGRGVFGRSSTGGSVTMAAMVIIGLYHVGRGKQESRWPNDP
jgi:hypothetical protein